MLVKDDVIQVSDNGLGMDEFIIENFFGRLGSSFYDQEKVKKEFEAIGQFGVGIFSYFLLGEFIDIETKTDNGDPLKFRIDKDPKNYFHFFKEPKRKKSGTTITLNLKKSIQEEYKFDDYYNYILKTFKHIEFPITIVDDDKEYEVLNSSFELDDEIEINKFIQLKYKNITNKFKLIKHSIKHEDYEGECGLIVRKLSKSNLVQDARLYFEYDFFSNIGHGSKSQISISQKGVFVNNYQSTHLMLMIGDINLKKGKGIGISRKNFTDTKAIENIINEFVSGLIDEYFQEIRAHFTLNEIAEISDSFLEHYLGSYFYHNDNHSLIKRVLGENIIIKFIDKNIELLTTFKNIDNDYNEFLLLSSLENIEDLKKITDLPMLVVNNYIEDGTYEGVYNILNTLYKFTPKILVSGNKAYQIMCKDEEYKNYKDINIQISNFLKYGFRSLEYIDSPYVVVRISKNKNEFKKEEMYEQLVLNSEHPHLKFISRNFKLIIKNGEFKNIIRSSFKSIDQISRLDIIESYMLKELNEVLVPLGEIEKPWVFTKEDFQPINKKF